ncbi:MAG: flagellar hook-associated protein FlgL [Steroidobacteraceae bacterium]
MQAAQTRLAKTQDQLATGKRVSTPADDPIASVRILEISRAKAQSAQYGANSAIATNRLSLEEQALNDSTTALQRVRELILQAANTGTLSDSDRQSIAAELKSRGDELRDIGNRQDGNGEFMFSGFSTLTRPFTRNAGGIVTYAGDQGSRVLQVGPSQRIADSDSGFSVFMDIPEGNGTFVTAAPTTNAGTGIIDIGSVVSQASWVPDDYAINFTSDTAYEVRNSSNALVSSGTYAPGTAITFNGVQVSVSGLPASGDRFTVNEAGTKDMFSLIDDIVGRLTTSSTTASQRSNLSSFIGGALQQLDQSLTQTQSARSGVGSRLSRLETIDTARLDYELELSSSLSDLQDLDYAEAITRMNQQLVALQAAQASYARVAQLSLFDYLR